ncbi:MAG: 5-formyltetrahydrofolate cyclo-ligase [Chitinophagaceae bacterium]|nr:5-formyltetrahydrofolate cyclo-ligase [Chitinophagaceae bacterium]
MTKFQLRSIYKAKRNALAESEVLKMDDLLLIKFQELHLGLPQSLLTYWPMGHHTEPNVELVTRYLHLMIPELQICYPEINPVENSMNAVVTNDDTQFKTNQWGITEPVDGAVFHPQKLDLIFVPLLAFDKKGFRVGFGKGYYDRFLPECNEALKIGFSYFDPVEEISDTNQFDVPLNYCITPQHIYEF